MEVISPQGIGPSSGRSIVHVPERRSFVFSNCVFHRLFPRRRAYVEIPESDVGLPFPVRTGDTREKNRTLLPTTHGYVYFTGSPQDKIALQKIRSKLLRDNPLRKPSLTAFMPWETRILLLLLLIAGLVGALLWFTRVLPSL